MHLRTMGMFPRLNFRAIFGVFRKPAIAVWTVAAAVPMSVFGASSLYGRHTAAPTVEDFHETYDKSLREPSPAEVLKSHLEQRLLRRLFIVDETSAPDFYEDILTEALLYEQTKESWCFHEMLQMRYRLYVLRAYLQFTRGFPSLPGDFDQDIAVDIVKKIQKTKEAINGHRVLRDCGEW